MSAAPFERSASAAKRAARSAKIIACAAARSAGSDSGVRVTAEGNPIHRCPQARSSSNRGRTPRCLGMTPVDAGEQIAELGGRDRHHPVGGARPQKAPALQLFCEQACPLAVMPDHLQQIAPPPTKAEEWAAQG